MDLHLNCINSFKYQISIMAEEKLPLELKKEIRAKAAVVKPLLPRGTNNIVAKEFGVSAQFVADVVVGRRWDLRILERLTEIGEENFKRAKQLNKRLDKIKEETKKS